MTIKSRHEEYAITGNLFRLKSSRLIWQINEMNLQSRLGILIAIALLSKVSISCSHNSQTARAAQVEPEGAWNDLAPRPMTGGFFKNELILSESKAEQMLRRTLLSTELSKLEQEIDALVKEPEKLLNRLTQIAEEEGSFELKSHIVYQLANAGLLDRARQIAETSNDYKLPLHVALQLAAAGRNEAADQLLEQAIAQLEAEPLGELKIRHSAEVALKLAEIGRNEAANQLFERAIAQLEAEPSDNAITQERSLFTIVDHLIAAKRFERALQLVQDTRPSASQVEAWADIAVGLAEQGQITRANTLLSEALAVAQTLTGGHLSNGSCYVERGDALAAVVEGLSAVQRRAEALDISEDIPNCFDVYSQIADDYRGYAYSDIVRDSATLSEIEEVIGKIQPTVNSGTGEGYAAVAAATLRLVELGEIERASQVVELIEKPPEQAVLYGLVQSRARGYRDNVFAAIASSLKDSGDFERAVQIVEQIQERSSKSFVLVEIGQALEQAGQTARAEEIFSQAISLLLEGSEQALAARLDWSAEILVAFARAGQIDRTLQLAEPLSDLRISWLDPVVVELVRLGYADAALQIALNAEFPEPKAYLLASIAAEILSVQDSQ